MEMALSTAVIGGIRAYLPAHEVTNEELGAELGWSADEILRKTGIASRRVSSPEECVSDMAAAAAKQLLADFHLDPARIDFLILCTQTPDYYLPTTACLVHSRLGLSEKCAAFDLNQGCSGFIYSLAVAASLIQSGICQQGIVLTADTYTKLIHAKDRSVRTLFGDGATATWLHKGKGIGIGQFALGTDGTGADNLIVPAGALRQRSSADTEKVIQDEGGSCRTLNNLYMNGPALFEFALRRVPELAKQVVERNGLESDWRPDWYVFHQANLFMLERLRVKMGIPSDRMVHHLRDVGNTVSSTIPLALHEYERLGRFQAGQRLMLLGFGVGYSWGGTILTWA